MRGEYERGRDAGFSLGFLCGIMFFLGVLIIFRPDVFSDIVGVWFRGF